MNPAWCHLHVEFKSKANKQTTKQKNTKKNPNKPKKQPPQKIKETE